ncbi:MAG: hypothetical protein Tsb0014_20290 [Pleurocapsa sp.]
MNNKNTSGFDILIKIDDQIIGIYNSIQRGRFLLSGQSKKYNLHQNIELKNKHQGQRCFIIGNGPSIKQQDLTLLKDEWTFCVNYFYKHPQITEIRPKYYGLIDPKLITGEWPISMIEEIVNSCPGTQLLMNAKYQDSPIIVNQCQNLPIYWLYNNQFLHEGFSCSSDLTKGLGSSTVITSCLFAAIYMGFSEIYLLGLDCDGIFRDLVDQSSHFYEAAKENIGDNDPFLVIRNLRSSIQGLQGWRAIAQHFENSPHKIVNLTNGGLLNVFPRNSLEAIVREKKLSNV